MILKKIISNSKNKILTSVFILLINLPIYSDSPVWSVNMNLYTYSMVMVGTVYVNDVESTDPIGKVGAFVGNECRGVISPKYNPVTGHFTYYLMIFGNTEGEKISFKYYDGINDKIETFTNTIDFHNDGSIGTDNEPFVWSKNDLDGTSVEEFCVKGSICSEISDSIINIIVENPDSIRLTKPKFKLSPGALAKVMGDVQRSAISEVDLSDDVFYNIISGNRKSFKRYRVRKSSNYMHINSRVVINGEESADINDTLYAIVDGVVRGKSIPKYDDKIGKYRFNTKVYGKLVSQKIKFNFYDSSTGLEIPLIQEIELYPDVIVGSNSDPVYISNNSSDKVIFKNIRFPEQILPTIIKNDNAFKIVVSEDTDKSSLIPTFETSDESTVRVNGNIQYSGISSNDFSNIVTYQVTSSNDQITKNFTVEVISTSMNIKSRVVVNGEESADINDTLYATVDGVVRGKSTPEYDSTIGKYRFNTKVYGKLETQNIKFNIYDHSNGLKIPLMQEIEFNPNVIVGTNSDPIFISNSVSNKVEFKNIRISEQIRQTIIKNENTFKIIVPDDTDKSSLIPIFETSDESTVRVNGNVQYSGISANDFSDRVTYQVTSSDKQATKDYNVEIFSTSMNIVSRVIINGKEAKNIEDTLFAYINGVLHAKAVPEYDGTVKQYRVNMKIYNNDDDDKISFAYFDKKLNKLTELVNSIGFKTGMSLGSIVDPIVLYDKDITQASMANFSVDGQIRPTVKGINSNFKIIIDETNTRFNPIVAKFDIPEAATVRVGDRIQYSGITPNDFSEPVIYEIYSCGGNLLASYVVSVFSSNMNISARVVLNNREVRNPSDTLYAYIDGVMREKVSPIYVNYIDKYRFNMQIFNDKNGEKIRFKYYDNNLKAKSDLIQTLEFKADTILGTVNDPLTFSDTELKLYKFKSFSIVGQTALYKRNNDTIQVVIPEDTDKSEMIAVFEVDDEAVVKIGSVVQYSGITQNSFDSDVVYSVHSGNGFTKRDYIVQVFSSSMIVNAKVVLDNVEISDENDTLIALIDGVERDKKTPEFDNSIKKYRFNMKIYDNNPGQKIDFKYYKYSIGRYINLNQNQNFILNGSVGTYSDPFLLSNFELTDNRFENFSLKNQIGETIYDDNNVIKVIVENSADVTNQTAIFNIEDGTTVRVNNIVQYSGISENDFSNPVTYSVISGDGDNISDYTVIAIKSDLESLEQTVILSPNGDGENDYWTIEEPEKFRDSKFYIFNNQGALVYSSLGYNNDWDGTFSGNELPQGTYYYIIKSPTGSVLHKGSISLFR